MHRPLIAAAVVLVVLSAAAPALAAPAPGPGERTHDRLCIQHTFPDGTSTPMICVPFP